jgi:hypothetical protein
MTSDDFRQSLTATEPPPGLTHALAGLWWDEDYADTGEYILLSGGSVPSSWICVFIQVRSTALMSGVSSQWITLSEVAYRVSLPYRTRAAGKVASTYRRMSTGTYRYQAVRLIEGDNSVNRMY